ncbi:cyclic nucleotide-binding domain-containing protein [Desulforhopalus sp. 52FAK]
MTRNDKDEVIESVKKSIESAERERRKLRFQHNFLELKNGRIHALKNEEFLVDFLDFLKTNRDENDNEQTVALDCLRSTIVNDDIAIRERALAVLSQYSQFVHDKNDKVAMTSVMDLLYSWVIFETEVLPGSVVLCKRVEELLEWLIWKGLVKNAEKMLFLLSQIHLGQIEKSAAIRSMAGNCIDSLKKKSILETLTDGYLAENELRQYYKRILILLRSRAVAYLLNRIIESHSRVERLAIVDLLKLFGDDSIPVLLKCLKSEQSWSVIRNVIVILSEIGDLDLYENIEQYCNYPDERVQLEVVRFIAKFEGEEKNNHLINALSLVGERLKIHVLRLLVEQGEKNEDAFNAIRDLAEMRGSFSASAGTELLSAIITTLKYFPYPESVHLLQEMRNDYSKSTGGSHIVLLIDGALNIIEPQIRHSSREQGVVDDMISFDADPMRKKLAYAVMNDVEQQVQRHVKKGEQKEAGDLIYEQAVNYLNQKDYTVAEMLRDRLLEVNPLALSEVIQLGELIEEHKSNSITSHHIEIWNDLYEEMTSEEFSTLYYALCQENYNKGDIIVKSGETDSSLYFVNSGYISMSCVAGGNEVFLKRMQPSDILGIDQFLFASVWTVSLTAISAVQLHVLDQAKWAELVKVEPGIEDKLLRYCNKYKKISELLQMSGDDRREFPRHSVSLITKNMLLDPYGKKGKRNFNGELIDISRAGLAFTIRIANKENAKLLLGRQIVTTIAVEGKELKPCSGVIVGVRIHDPDMFNFSVHVKLSKKIDAQSLQKIIENAGV